MQPVPTLASLREDFHALDFPLAASSARPAHASVRALREKLEAALAGDAFLLDCIELELQVIDRDEARIGLVPFHVMGGLGVRMSLGYWGPGQATGAHEHNDWTVTAVCHNALEVFTYDLDAAREGGHLVQKNRHAAPAGKAGHIYDPCVHNPWNPTRAWSMSIHLVGPHDGEVVDGKEPFHARGSQRARFTDRFADHPFARCARARQRQASLRVLSSVLARSRDLRAPRLLEEVFHRGDLRTRREAHAALEALDAARALRLAPALDASRIESGSRLVMPEPALERAVRAKDGLAELYLDVPGGEQLALRVGDRAREALETLARETSLVVGDLPGDLDDEERVELVEALVGEWALFEVASPSASTSFA
ncbi:MAG TPA: hypothetical protein VGI39_29105 [Polyangiaceae bacterium]|jgi:hypothetical protein